MAQIASEKAQAIRNQEKSNRKHPSRKNSVTLQVNQREPYTNGFDITR